MYRLLTNGLAALLPPKNAEPPLMEMFGERKLIRAGILITGEAANVALRPETLGRNEFGFCVRSCWTSDSSSAIRSLCCFCDASSCLALPRSSFCCDTLALKLAIS